MRWLSNRYRELCAERGALIARKWSGETLTARQRRRLAAIGRSLDRIEMAAMAPDLKRWDRILRKAAHRLKLRPASPPSRSSDGRTG